MKTIVVGAEKGGTGKTTVAVNLAAEAVRRGLDTLLVDADPKQQSAARWAARRLESHPETPAITCVTVTGRTIAAQLRDLARRYAIIIVDTGAMDSPELRAAATVATRLVLPVQPEMFDFWTLPTMETVFEGARRDNPELDAVIVLNRVPYQTAAQATADADAWLAENVPGLPRRIVPVIGRAAFGRANAEGLGIAEMPKRDPKAFTEIQRLYREAVDGN
jgi:chromosome partitioning protein